MKIKQAYTAIFILTILANAYLVYVAGTEAQVTTPTLTVGLNKPDNNTAKTDNFNQTFTFTPILTTSDSFQRATLILNGTFAATNQTAISNNTVSSISYTFTGNGTWFWDIQLEATNHSPVTSTEYSATLLGARNITVAVFIPNPTPTPTPTPSPTATPTLTPTTTPIVTPTASPTPTPTPPPSTNDVLSTWTIVAIAIVVIAVVGGIAIFMLRRRGRS